MRLKKSLEKLVAWERVCRVATVGRGGVPHSVPVCHVLERGKLYFGSEKDARKVRNLRANPNASVTVDLYSEDWANLKGVMIQGSASLIEGGPRFRKIRRLLYTKFPQYPAESAIGERDSVIVEITPRTSSRGASSSPRHAISGRRPGPAGSFLPVPGALPGPPAGAHEIPATGRYTS